MRSHFAVKHERAWRVAEGQYDEKSSGIQLIRTEQDILEAIRGAVKGP